MYETSLKTSDFDYYLPDGLIAQTPPRERGSSRLMVVHRDSGLIEHKRFPDIASYLTSDDLLVLNDTKVIRARLKGRKYGGGAAVEVLIDRRVGERTFEALARPSKRLETGDVIEFARGFYGEVRSMPADGRFDIYFSSVSPFSESLDKYGEVPLPPYIRTSRSKAKGDTLEERYQTVYALKDGASAAPTAGLHFTRELLASIPSQKTYVTLHTGYGTFAPVRSEYIRDHHMHSESYEISREALSAVRDAKSRKGRVVAVGTTTVRLLESVASAGRGETDIFISPGFKFGVVDAMVTNFHLPRSTLMMLVCAFGGRDLIMKAYREAVGERYRFFSFGDAMLIL